MADDQHPSDSSPFDNKSEKEEPPSRSYVQEVVDLDEHSELPPEIAEFRQELIMFEATSGSMPPPSMLSRYNEVIPNGAERIVAMAESQQSHRMELENRVVDSDISIRNRALHLGFLVVMAAIVGGVILALMGLEIIGSTMIATGLISSGLAFFKGIAAKEERMSRQKADKD